MVDILNQRLSALLESQLPDFVKTDYPTFQAFLEAYYEWLEQRGNPFEAISNYTQYRSIDKTVDEFIKYFRDEFMVHIPEAALMDKRLLTKHIKEFYRTRGNEKSYQFLFKLLFNDNTLDFYYPGTDILRASDGIWTVDTTLKVIQTADDITDSTHDGIVLSPLSLKSVQIVGKTSGASAIINFGIQYHDNAENETLFVIELFIDKATISGAFSVGERIIATDESGKKIYATTVGVINAINIVSGGKNYSVNDAINFENTGTGGGSAVAVIEVVGDGRILSATIVDGGDDYLVGDEVVIDNTGTGGHDCRAKVTTVDASETTLLLNFEEEEGQTSTSDESQYNMEVIFNNNAKITRLDKRLGVGCLFLDGANILEDSSDQPSYISLLDSSDSVIFADSTNHSNFDFSDNDFSIDFDVKLFENPQNTTSVKSTCFVSRMGSNGNRSFAFAYYTPDDSPTDILGNAITEPKLVFHAFEHGGDSVIDHVDAEITGFANGELFAPDTWYHLAVSRVGTTYKFYLNEEEIGSAVGSDMIFNSTNRVVIGGWDSIDNMISGSFYVNGYIDSFRIMNGKALSSDTTFPVPTTPPKLQGPITGVTVTSRGNNYSKVPTADLSDSGDGTAQITFVGDDNVGKIIKVKIIKSGVGYTSAPGDDSTNSISASNASNGSGAILSADIGTITSYPGRFFTTRGQLDEDKFLQDNFFYQAYSYVLKSETTISEYRDIVKKILHPAGMALFGQTQVVTVLNTEIRNTYDSIEFLYQTIQVVVGFILGLEAVAHEQSLLTIAPRLSVSNLSSDSELSFDFGDDVTMDSDLVSADFENVSMDGKFLHPAKAYEFDNRYTVSNDFNFTRASEEQYVSDTGEIKIAEADVPRIQFSNVGEMLGLLVNFRKNIFLWSEQFNHTEAWSPTAGITVSADVETAPNDTLTADKIATATSNFERTVQSVAISDQPLLSYTSSVYLMKGDTDVVDWSIEFLGGSSQLQTHLIFRFSTKKLTELQGIKPLDNYGVIDVGNGWFRIWASQTNNSSGNNVIFSSIIPGTDESFNHSPGFVYAWGAQLEKVETIGQAPSAYIESTDAATVGNSDSLSLDLTLDSTAGWFNPERGTFIMDIIPQSIIESGNIIALVEDSDNLIWIDYTSADSTISPVSDLRLNVKVDGVTTATITSSLVDVEIDKVSTIGFCYRAGRFSLVIDGVIIGSDNPDSLPSFTEITFGQLSTTIPPGNHIIKNIQYYDQDLPEYSLKKLTS